MKKLVKVLILFMFPVVIISCGKPAEKEGVSEQKTIILYCGAGIRPATEKLIKAFHKQNPDVKVSATYAGSGRLLGQLTASRRGDLFMPGTSFYVDKAIESKLADAESKRDVACFIPVLFVQKGNPKGIHSLNDLVKRGVRIGLGDKRAVAVGKKSVQLFKKNGISEEKIKENLVYSSGTVNELAMAIELKNIDATIVWDANARQYEHIGDMIEIPPQNNLPVTIPIVKLQFSQYPEAAVAFIDFVTSEEGIKILKAEKYTVK